jgi:hypothetical protein
MPKCKQSLLPWQIIILEEIFVAYASQLEPAYKDVCCVLVLPPSHQKNCFEQAR